LTDNDSNNNGLDFAGIKSSSTHHPIQEESFAFALEIIQLHNLLEQYGERVFSKELLRTGTRVGANIEEAFAATTRNNCIHSLSVARKDARETIYWLRLLHRSSLVPGLDVMKHLQKADEIVGVVTEIIDRFSPTK
jgi:four helix bundle protein